MPMRIDDLPDPLIAAVADVMRFIRTEEQGEPGRVIHFWPDLNESCALASARDCGLIEMNVTFDGFFVKRNVRRK